MGSFYESSNEIAILQDRIGELSRIRQGFAAHLGASLYEATKDDEQLRWGRESLYDGIALCDNERERLLAKITALQQTDTQEAHGSDDAVISEFDLPFGVPAEEDLDPNSPIVVDDEPEEETAIQVEEIEDTSDDSLGFELESVFDMDYESEGTVDSEADTVSDGMPAGVPYDDFATEELSEEAPSLEIACDVVQPKVHLAGSVYHETQSEHSSEALEERICPKCGAIARPNDKFCMECGARLSDVIGKPHEVTSESKPAVCPECGSRIDPSFRFCMTCGHRL